MPVIEVEHLTKEYRLGALQSLKQTVLNVGARLSGRPAQERPLFKALDDVNFTIEQGEVVGIIGHNGAGKSTLLKMLARISTPTRGSVNVRGRVAPLIEVGAGFVPDFTGRENVYLNGAILGMSKSEIDRKFDDIVEFAEMAEFIDTPVKRYSSGMQVKLAFSVSTSIDADILIVDEVLAVGDLAYQRKCFDRMEDLIKRNGNTILLVSHNIRQVQRLCSRTILMDHGRVFRDGKSQEVCELFYAQNDMRIAENLSKERSDSALENSLANFRLLSIQTTDRNSSISDTFQTGSPITIAATFETKFELIKPIFAMGVHTTDFLYLGSERSADKMPLEALPAGIHTVTCTFDNLPFLPGVYSIRMSVVSGAIPTDVYYAENLAHFHVTPPRGYALADMSGEGFVQLESSWHLD